MNKTTTQIENAVAKVMLARICVNVPAVQMVLPRGVKVSKADIEAYFAAEMKPHPTIGGVYVP